MYDLEIRVLHYMLFGDFLDWESKFSINPIPDELGCILCSKGFNSFFECLP